MTKFVTSLARLTTDPARIYWMITKFSIESALSGNHKSKLIFTNVTNNNKKSKLIGEEKVQLDDVKRQ